MSGDLFLLKNTTKSIKIGGLKTFFFRFSPSFWQKKTIQYEWRPFFIEEHHKIHRKTLVLEAEDYLRLNLGPRKFWNSKFGP